MKRLLLVIVSVGIATEAFAGHLTGGVDLNAGTGSRLLSYGWAEYDQPPLSDTHGEQMAVTHVISFDGGPGGVIAYNSASGIGVYSYYIQGNGTPSTCYRARLTAKVPGTTLTNVYTSGARCVTSTGPPPPVLCGPCNCHPSCIGYPYCEPDGGPRESDDGKPVR